MKQVNKKIMQSVPILFVFEGSPKLHSFDKKKTVKTVFY